MAAASQVRDCCIARVLLVDDDPTSRLTLKTLLETCGYSVEAAASAAEAVGKLEEGEFSLVLSDLQLESPQAGLKVLAHAKMMYYKPATALLTTYQDAQPAGENWHKSLLIKPEDIPDLVTKIAGMISDRAARRLRREMVLAGI